MTKTSKRKGLKKLDEIAIPFPADANSFSLQSSIKLSEEVNKAKHWGVTARRNVESAVEFLLEDEHGEVREIEWMKFHTAVLCKNWKVFDYKVNDIKVKLEHLKGLKSKFDKPEMHEELARLEKMSDSELFTMDMKILELISIASKN